MLTIDVVGISGFKWLLIYLLVELYTSTDVQHSSNGGFVDELLEK